MKQTGFNAQLVVGLIIVVIGVLFTLDNLGYLYADDYLDYWPAVFIVIGLAKLLDANANKFWAGFFVIGGTLLLLDNLYIIQFRIRDWWPLILIAIGGTVLWGSLRRHSKTAIFSGSQGMDDLSVVSLTAIMGGIERRNASQDFHGGNITTIMGGCELDLRKADIKQEEAVLDVFAVWGGIELKVPETWTVILKGVPILGGFSDETRPPQGATGKRLVIQGNVIMGGLEVKN